MKTYFIHFKSESLYITVGGDLVIQSPGVFRSFVGKPWSDLLQLCENLGLIVEPISPESKSDFITIDDATYEIRWNSSRTQPLRFSVHRGNRVYDVKYENLPLIIKMVL